MRHSTQVADVILSSWRKNTVKQYNVYLEKWSKFCLSRQSHFMRAPDSLILDFFHDLYTKGCGYSSLNTVRSAISALYSIDKTDVGQNIGKHPLICRFLMGVFNEIPPTPEFREVWPMEQVLAYLTINTSSCIKVKGTYVEIGHACCNSNWTEMPNVDVFGYFERTHEKIPKTLHFFFIETP